VCVILQQYYPGTEIIRYHIITGKRFFFSNPICSINNIWSVKVNKAKIDLKKLWNKMKLIVTSHDRDIT